MEGFIEEGQEEASEVAHSLTLSFQLEEVEEVGNLQVEALMVPEEVVDNQI